MQEQAPSGYGYLNGAKNSECFHDGSMCYVAPHFRRTQEHTLFKIMYSSIYDANKKPLLKVVYYYQQVTEIMHGHSLELTQDKKT